MPLCLTAWPFMVNACHHWTHLETIAGDTASHPRRLESSSRFDKPACCQPQPLVGALLWLWVKEVHFVEEN